MQNNVLIRVEAGSDIGYGHLYRCVVLASRFLLDGYNCVFVTSKKSKESVENIVCNRFDVVTIDAGFNSVCELDDARLVVDIYRQFSSCLVVLDSYALGIIWERCVSSFNIKILVIDDLLFRGHQCEFFLDQNIRVDMDNFSRSVECSVSFEGPRYSLISDDYAEKRKLPIIRDKGINNVLIFLGGGDAFNLTDLVLRVICGLETWKDFNYSVVLGQSTDINPLIYEKIKIKTYCNLPTLSDLILSTDFCIGAPGSSAWERACLGLPSALISYADNQKRIGNALHHLELAYYIGHYPVVTESEIRSSLKKMMSTLDFVDMSGKGMGLVDGLGAQRVVRRIVGHL